MPHFMIVLIFSNLSWVIKCLFLRIMEPSRQNYLHGVFFSAKWLSVSFLRQVCLFVFRFYGPVNPMGSCRARSVYLTTRLLGRLSPLTG